MKITIPVIVTLLFAWQGYSQSKIDSIRPKADVKWDTLSMEFKRDVHNNEVESKILDYYQTHDTLNSMDFIIEIKYYLLHPDGSRKLRGVSVDTLNDNGNAYKYQLLRPKNL